MISLNCDQENNTDTKEGQFKDRLILFFREAKQKETWFWALYPLFYQFDDQPPIGAATGNTLDKPNEVTNIAHNTVGAITNAVLSKPRSSAEDSLAQDWFNLILSRAFRDLLSHYKWRRWVRRKCQQKLRRLPLPQFIDPLRVRKVALSSQFPRLSNPTGHKDTDGQAMFSFELDASPIEGEESVFDMTLETKINASFFTHYRETGDNRDPDLAGMSDDEDDEQEVSFDTVSSSSDDEDEQFETLPFDGEVASVNSDSIETEPIKTSQSDSVLNQKAELPLQDLAGSPTKPTATPKTLFEKLRVKGSVLLNKNKTVIILLTIDLVWF